MLRTTTMLTRLFIVLLATLLSSCQLIPKTSTEARTQRHNGPITNFTHVQINGKIDINLYTGANRPKVSLHGDPRDVANINVRVQNRVLYISLNKGYPKYGQVHADVLARYITSFSYKGHGTVLAENIHAGYLDASIQNTKKTILNGSIDLHHLTVIGPGYTKISGITGDSLSVKLLRNPRVQLKGTVKLNSLTLNGKGLVSMYWVDSDWLTIRARDNAIIQMAGRTNVLDLELWDHARFNGHYLRGKRVFAKTHNKAVADISTTKHQHTLAADASNIYFHELPDTQTNFMAENGSVLDLRDWNLRFEEEPDRYNH